MAKIKTVQGNTYLINISELEKVEKHVWEDKNGKVVANIKGEEVELIKFVSKKENPYQKVKGNNFMRDNITEHPERHKGPLVTNKTGYKGVFKVRDRFAAEITVEGEKIRLGTFDTAEDAALEYNEAVKDFWNGDGYMNKIKTS